jgi:hypothetical protein
VTGYTQPCKPCKVTYILHYLPQGDESSPRGSWGICAPALPDVLIMKSNRSPLGAALSASMVPTAKAKHQAKFKRLKKKRLITECADEDDTDDDDLFLIDVEKP